MNPQHLKPLSCALLFSLLQFNLARAATIDLAYDPSNGQVLLETNGQDMISFNLQNDVSGFNDENTDFSDLPPGLTDNSPTDIGWFSLVGANGEVDLGSIFPAGLESQAAVEAFLTNRMFGLMPPDGGGELAVVLVPEPTCLVMLISSLAALSLVRRRRTRRDAI